MNKGLARASILAVALFSACQVFAQTDIAVAKSNLVVNGTNTYVAANTGGYFTVVGRVTSPFLSFTNETELYIQSTSAGIRVWSKGSSFRLETNGGVFVPGVEVTVFGAIHQTNGMRSIRPESYNGSPYDSGNDFFISGTTTSPVSPVVTDITNYLALGEDFEGKLIRINGLSMGNVSWSYQANTPVVVTDSTGTLTFFVDRDTDVAGQLPPTNTFDCIGIAAQYSTATVPSNGYEIMPRSYSDIIQTVGQEPPFISVQTSVTVYANSAMNLAIVAQDRNAADTLVLTTNSAPAGAGLAQVGNRAYRLTWSPALSDIGTTSAVLQLTDGTSTTTATVQITVRRASGGPGFAWINELHYDNTGVDTNEGVELAGQSGVDLTNYTLVLYTSYGDVYRTDACTNVIDNEGYGYGAVWQAYPLNALRNGTGGVALVHSTAGLLQFISYGGSSIAATSGPAAGITSVDVGVKETGSEPVGQSLQLAGNGTNYEDFTWVGPITASPGDLNYPTQVVLGPVNAKISYTSLALNPAAPTTNQAFHIECSITPNGTASNLAPTAWYRLNSNAWSSIAMSDMGANAWRTSSQVPGQTNNSLIEYYVSTLFGGPGSASPMSSQTNSYLLLTHPPTIAPVTNKTVQVSNLVAFVVSATEPDGNLITLTASNLPANAAFYPTNGVSASSGSFVFTPDASQGGNVYTALFYAVDADGAGWTSVVITVNFSGYLVDFEDATKTSYTSNNVTLNGKLWSMSESLIGNSTADRKYGLQSSRTRYAGRIMMLEDKTSGCGQITFKYAKYGTDAASTGRVEYSTDGGNAWTQAGADFVATTTDPMQDFSATVNITNNVRIRITKLAPTNNSARFNVDNILIADYSAPTYQDGIPVAWWERYGLGSTNTAANDNDGDGRSNWEEFIADSNPTNSSSFFPTSTTNISGKATMILYAGPPTTNSRVYDAWWNTDLVSGAWTPYNFNVQGNADGSAVALTVTNSTGLRFYQTGVKMLP